MVKAPDTEHPHGKPLWVGSARGGAAPSAPGYADIGLLWVAVVGIGLLAFSSLILASAKGVEGAAGVNTDRGPVACVEVPHAAH